MTTLLNPKNLQPTNWASAYGEDAYGLWVELTYQQVTQRFRWIEAGTFMMGSPKDEEGRYSDESLHQVTLSQGFWLADTVVTQALWQVVMEDNPSHFKGDDLPVEKVSWHDANKFIVKLNALLKPLQPEYNLSLPSEAQWEYACRAGTNTAFNYGSKADSKLMNYRGTWDSFTEWGEGALQKTSAVKRYAPNNWGLYAMHGNVWEWCQDEWTDSLGTKPVTDPLNQSGEKQASSQEQDKARRVVRGGSWYDYGRRVRSAIRDSYDPDNRHVNIGFRFFLGLELQSSQETGKERKESTNE